MTKKHHAHAVDAMRKELAARDRDEQVVADQRLFLVEERDEAPPRRRRTRRDYDADRHHFRQEILHRVDEQDDGYVALLRDAHACLLENDREGFARAVGAAIELRVREEVHAMTLELVTRLTRLGAPPHTQEEEA
jgi:hypothetical protein